MAPRQAARLGVDLDFKGADWPAIRDRVFGRIDPISAAGREWRRNGPGVTLFEGHASFVDAHTLLVGDVQISADQIVIATGSRPRPLSIEVPEELRSRFYTSDDVMRIAELPRRLIVLGGGFVACEFAQIFAGLGSQVTQINRSEVLLRGEDHEVSEAFKEEQAKLVNLILNQKISAAETGPDGEVLVITTDRNGVEYEYLADAVLVATGRVRNSDSLNLAAAGVEVGPGGQIRVDKYQRTSQPNIWALGDVSSNYLLKHVANAEARTVAANLLAGDGELVATDHRYVPHAVFTDPQIASVGATEQQLREWGDAVCGGLPALRGRRLRVGAGGRGSLREAAGRPPYLASAGRSHHRSAGCHPDPADDPGHEPRQHGPGAGPRPVLDSPGPARGPGECSAGPAEGGCPEGARKLGVRRKTSLRSGR